MITSVDAVYWFQVTNGVKALKACVAKLKEQKKDLFALGDTEYIFLQFGFKKVSLQRQTTKVYAVYTLSANNILNSRITLLHSRLFAQCFDTVGWVI